MFPSHDRRWTTPTAIQHGDVIGRPARFRGHDGSTFPATRGEIRGQARGNWSTGSHGTELVFSTTPSGTTSMQDMLMVNQAGTDLLYGKYNISGSPHIHTLSEISGSREVLTSNRTYYVRTDGSDSNDGLTDSSGGAFLTIQKAVDVVAALDISVYDVTIQVKDGTYTGAVILEAPLVGSGKLTIQGNSGTPSNVLISVTSNNAFTADLGAIVTIKDLKIVTTTSGHHLRTGS